MAGVNTPTPIQAYALGRDCVVDLLFQLPSATSPTAAYSVGMRICISEGTLNLESDVIEIGSNCQKGWKVKLPGLKSGTLTFTGYLAISSTPQSDNDKLAISTYLGKFCQCAIWHMPTDQDGDWTGESAFDIEPKTVGNDANGLVRSLNITVTPDDVCKVNGTIELTGDQSFFAYMAVSGFEG
jgi:hypothetical protein